MAAGDHLVYDTKAAAGRALLDLSWCYSVLCTNQLKLLWVNFCIGGYMYYIGATVSSRGGASFF